MQKKHIPLDPQDLPGIQQLAIAVMRRAPLDALTLLEGESDEVIADVLEALSPDLAVRILSHMDEKRSEILSPQIEKQIGEQWSVNLGYDEDSIGRIMEPPLDAFKETMTVAELVESMRETATTRQIVYAFVVEDDMTLIGLVVLRDLLFAKPEQRLQELMISDPFAFSASTSVVASTEAALLRHYPIYPVCDSNNRLVGQIRGYALFERRNFTLTAQTGQMVGVEKEEHIGTPWFKCLLMRHPWLQVNLLTGFLAGSVVGLFEETIAQIVVLAVFLPILAGQSGNTGCQALAVTLRGMTLNELKPGMEIGLIRKEALLGMGNGLLVGITAALGMFAYSSFSGNESALTLSIVVFFAMLGACIVSGVIGVIIPLILRRLGADPVTASTIFLTTITDIASMGFLLALATIVLI
ncbi:MAG: magnesium transporter [Planctomycetota bacterium]|jgi:magnesium transporter